MKKFILSFTGLLMAVVIYSQESLTAGSIAPDIQLQSADGNTATLSSLQGNIVYLYFWASWNDPGIKESDELRALYDSYKTKGFEIFAVSLDRERAEWLKAIKENNLNWTNVSDLKYWRKKLFA